MPTKTTSKKTAPKTKNRAVPKTSVKKTTSKAVAKSVTKKPAKTLIETPNKAGIFKTSSTTTASKNILPDELAILDDALAQFITKTSGVKYTGFTSNKEKGRVFEKYAAKVLEANGYRIESMPGHDEHSKKSGITNGDGGIDIVAYKFYQDLFEDRKERYAVQCKYYTTKNASRAEIERLVTSSKTKCYDCDHAMFISTSDFSSDAKSAAKEWGVITINGNKFAKMMKKLK